MSETYWRIGIDIGTTSCKICVLRNNENRILHEGKTNHDASISSRGDIQDTKCILRTSQALLNEAIKFCSDSSPSDIHIDLFICGQMHGVVLWVSDSLDSLDIDNIECTNLFTWLYNPQGITDITSNVDNLHPGFGVATLAYLSNNSSQSIAKYDSFGSIMDLFATILTNSKSMFITYQIAQSFGYDCKWKPLIPPPLHLHQPAVVQRGAAAATTYSNLMVHLPFGDLQASINSVAQESAHTAAYLIIGTSAQFCVLSDDTHQHLPPTVVRLPYSKRRHLYAACSMNGGNAISSIIELYSIKTPINKLLEEFDNQHNVGNHNIIIDPIFNAERNASHIKFQSNASFSSEPFHVIDATLRGIIRNLFRLFSLELLHSFQINDLILIGPKRFQKYIEEETRDSFKVHHSEVQVSAAYGVTLPFK